MNPLRWWSFVQDADRFEAEKASYAWEQAGRPDYRTGLSLPRAEDGSIAEHAEHHVSRTPVSLERCERTRVSWWRRLLGQRP